MPPTKEQIRSFSAVTWRQTEYHGAAARQTVEVGRNTPGDDKEGCLGRHRKGVITQSDARKHLFFRVPKSLGWRGFKIILFMIYLWFEYDFHLWFFYGFKLWLWFFMVWIWFFYDFFVIFLVLRIWFSAKNSRNFRFFYDFARVSFPQSLFSRKFDFGSKIVKKS